jgi:flavodoxin
MDTIVIYASTSGNTRTVAESISDALRPRGSARAVSVDEDASVPEADLTIIGAPTEGHTVSKPMRAWLHGLPDGAFAGRSVAAFDTRLRWPRFLSGSAAEEIAKRVSALGGRLLAPPESFMVTMKPELELGELQRAATWAGELADVVVPTRSAAPA